MTEQSAFGQTGNKILDGNIVIRLSKMQRAILRYLAGIPIPTDSYIGNLPRTGDIIEAIGRARTPQAYSAVSRALHRLESRGLISSYASYLCIPGKGRRYALNHHLETIRPRSLARPRA